VVQMKKSANPNKKTSKRGDTQKRIQLKTKPVEKVRRSKKRIDSNVQISGPAAAAARIKRKKRKEKEKRQNEIDMLVTKIPNAIDATNVMRLISPRYAPRYTFHPALTNPEDEYLVQQLTEEEKTTHL
jgi:hypothetical protein